LLVTNGQVDVGGVVVDRTTESVGVFKGGVAGLHSLLREWEIAAGDGVQVGLGFEVLQRHDGPWLVDGTIYRLTGLLYVACLGLYNVCAGSAHRDVQVIPELPRAAVPAYTHVRPGVVVNFQLLHALACVAVAAVFLAAEGLHKVTIREAYRNWNLVHEVQRYLVLRALRVLLSMSARPAKGA